MGLGEAGEGWGRERDGSGGVGGAGAEEESINILFPLITRNKHLFPRSYCNRKLDSFVNRCYTNVSVTIPEENNCAEYGTQAEKQNSKST